MAQTRLIVEYSNKSDRNNNNNDKNKWPKINFELELRSKEHMRNIRERYGRPNNF